jgi:hypothetical protein
LCILLFIWAVPSVILMPPKKFEGKVIHDPVAEETEGIEIKY